MNDLFKLFENFDWESYKEISDSLMQFDEDALDDEIRKFSSLYSSYNAMLSKGKEVLSDEEQELTISESKVRSSAKSESRTKLTAKDLDDLVEVSDLVISKRRKVRKAKSKYDLLRGLVKALEAKKDMLIQASSNRRAESKLYNTNQ